MEVDVLGEQCRIRMAPLSPACCGRRCLSVECYVTCSPARHVIMRQSRDIGVCGAGSSSGKAAGVRSPWEVKLPPVKDERRRQKRR